MSSTFFFDDKTHFYFIRAKSGIENALPCKVHRCITSQSRDHRREHGLFLLVAIHLISTLVDFIFIVNILGKKTTESTFRLLRSRAILVQQA